MVPILASLLSSWDKDKILTKTAMIIAALAKTDAGRTVCCCSAMTVPLLHIMTISSSSVQVVTQVCRALGNICYENSEYLVLHFRNFILI